MMESQNLYTLNEAADQLAVSQDLVAKFISRGWIVPVEDGKRQKLTPYAFRRLNRIIDLYERSYSLERIETLLNH
ncbi:MAG TPA: MerR family transcriptional regulator [Caldithrix abyssi]|uniref:MerR family transcriptional regulator n=1 Tax=Caldithrix abyssi TaxID=187145 RepID=A0A7V5RNJ4_CALAY|nr:MerR family transcriptional regulator [Caldithrix abyssi]